jgi:16S rRNA (cytosine1402-N4)-methyltransferase
MLDALSPSGHLLGVDQDPEALDAAGNRLSEAISSGRLRLVRGNFRDLTRLLEAAGVTRVDGILLDLGVSSHQFDAAYRGFSHRLDGPLDMRMDNGARETASQMLDRLDEVDLRRLLREFGEEPRAKKLAYLMVRARPIARTGHLVAIVESAVPPPDRSKTLARVFQALRIAVNRELEVLETVLQEATNLTGAGGRLAVISYHSLEDRRVKRFLRYGNLEGQPRRDMMGNLLAPWTPINRRPIAPEPDEIERNPRARSARLRLAERQPNP